MEIDESEERIKALAEFLEVTEEDLGDIEESGWRENAFIYGGDEYLVLLEDEINDTVKDYIKDSVWAFNASFIIQHSDLPWEAIEMVQSFCQDKCEGANETILALINDLDEFVSDAISADGAGHFLAHYDGEEHEVCLSYQFPDEVDVKHFYYYIYRVD